MSRKTGLSAARAREMLDYNPSTGEFVAARNSGNRRVGDRAGNVRSDGYTTISVDGVQYLAHRLAWLVCHGSWPDGDIDHINGDAADNRIANIRVATPSQNLANSKRSRRNRSGHKGVHYDSHYRRWYATMRLKGKYVFVGSYLSKEDAVAARSKAGRDLHGEFHSDEVRVVSRGKT